MGKMKEILAYLMIALCLCEVAQNQANAVEVVQEVIFVMMMVRMRKLFWTLSR